MYYQCDLFVLDPTLAEIHPKFKLKSVPKTSGCIALFIQPVRRLVFIWLVFGSNKWTCLSKSLTGGAITNSCTTRPIWLKKCTNYKYYLCKYFSFLITTEYNQWCQWFCALKKEIHILGNSSLLMYSKWAKILNVTWINKSYCA